MGIPPIETALTVKELCKSYGSVDVLKTINVSMNDGDFLVLVGPSGCGKSTLLNCIAGLEETTSGTLYIGGQDVTEVPPRDRDIAMVFQSYALYPTMSVAENIAFGMKVRRRPAAEIKQKTQEVADLLQIAHLLDRRPAQLSGGQRQRVAMGRALVREPRLFLFDEPLSNLDAKLRVEMRAEIKRVHQTTGASIVYVTHDQIEAMTLATKIVVLKDGVVQQIGTPQEIYDQPANMFVADFMGAPPMNLIPARIQGRSAVLEDGQQISLSHTSGMSEGAEVVLGLRPEAFTPGTTLTVTAEMVEHAGSDTYVRAPLSGKNITLRLPGRVIPQEGAPLALNIDTSAVVLFDPVTETQIS